ncbi:hypothetical protein EDC01DRAFT_792044 [Geopyxis carbonaria]|nr:hypothetical protein EDC01DRAFT_792044 [Geopyxis carbonaria]
MSGTSDRELSENAGRENSVGLTKRTRSRVACQFLAARPLANHNSLCPKPTNGELRPIIIPTTPTSQFLSRSPRPIHSQPSPPSPSPSRPVAPPLLAMADAALPPPHDTFLTWATAAGITTAHITPAPIPHAGLGILATTVLTGPSHTKPRGATTRRGLSAGEDLAHTPASALLHRESAHTFAPALPPPDAVAHLSTHALLAAALALEAHNPAHPWAPWLAVLPAPADFAACMPLLWPAAAQALLPPAARALVAAQATKHAADAAAVAALPLAIPAATYTWAWLVVNTRTLFYKPESPAYAGRARADCLALCPFIDYFNHAASAGCAVSLSPAGYTVRAAAPHDAGAEVHVSYGCHSGDFLLAEYGFVLARNRWDEVRVDALVLPLLAPRHREYLDAEGFLGHYVLDREAFCFRAQAAVRMLLIPVGTAAEAALVERWRAWLRGCEEGEREQRMVDAYCEKILERMRTLGAEARAGIVALEEGGVRDTLEARWRQVDEIVECVQVELDAGTGTRAAEE